MYEVWLHSWNFHLLSTESYADSNASYMTNSATIIFNSLTEFNSFIVWSNIVTEHVTDKGNGRIFIAENKN